MIKVYNELQTRTNAPRRNYLLLLGCINEMKSVSPFLLTSWVREQHCIRSFFSLYLNTSAENFDAPVHQSSPTVKPLWEKHPQCCNMSRIGMWSSILMD